MTDRSVGELGWVDGKVASSLVVGHLEHGNIDELPKLEMSACGPHQRYVQRSKSSEKMTRSAQAKDVASMIYGLLPHHP